MFYVFYIILENMMQIKIPNSIESWDPWLYGSLVSGKTYLEEACEGAFELGQTLSQPGDIVGLQIRPSEDAAPELGCTHSPNWENVMPSQNTLLALSSSLFYVLYYFYPDKSFSWVSPF